MFSSAYISHVCLSSFSCSWGRGVANFRAIGIKVSVAVRVASGKTTALCDRLCSAGLYLNRLITRSCCGFVIGASALQITASSGIISLNAHTATSGNPGKAK